MTYEEIIEMAKEACFDPHDMSSDFTCNLENINFFANLVAAKEREACAKIVEDSPSYDWHKFACEAAAAIRARGEQT